MNRATTDPRRNVHRCWQFSLRTFLFVNIAAALSIGVWRNELREMVEGWQNQAVDPPASVAVYDPVRSKKRRQEYTSAVKNLIRSRKTTGVQPRKRTCKSY